jgi:hypothetical protein
VGSNSEVLSGPGLREKKLCKSELEIVVKFSIVLSELCNKSYYLEELTIKSDICRSKNESNFYRFDVNKFCKSFLKVGTKKPWSHSSLILNIFEYLLSNLVFGPLCESSRLLRNILSLFKQLILPKPNCLISRSLYYVTLSENVRETIIVTGNRQIRVIFKGSPDFRPGDFSDRAEGYAGFSAQSEIPVIFRTGLTVMHSFRPDLKFR